MENQPIGGHVAARHLSVVGIGILGAGLGALPRGYPAAGSSYAKLLSRRGAAKFDARIGPNGSERMYRSRTVPFDVLFFFVSHCQIWVLALLAF